MLRISFAAGSISSDTPLDISAPIRRCTSPIGDAPAENAVEFIESHVQRMTGGKIGNTEFSPALASSFFKLPLEVDVTESLKLGCGQPMSFTGRTAL
jgi:hypothetical protein